MPKTTAKKRKPRAKKSTAKSKGLLPGECLGTPPDKIQETLSKIENAGGKVISSYKDPLCGEWLVLAAIPIEKIEPTPFQRDLSEAHAKRLSAGIEKLGCFLDPIIAVPSGDMFWTPNGRHRLEAMTRLGAKTMIALVLSDPAIQFKILALNIEKSHNLREKSLEVIRMYRVMAPECKDLENEHAFEFEEPAFITLGICYEKNGRFSGGAYQSILKRVDNWFEEPLKEALKFREERAAQVQKLDARISEIVKVLQDRGLKSPYLKTFVVARINYLRFVKTVPSFDEAFEELQKKADRFNTEKIEQKDLAGAAGSTDE